MDLLPRYSDDRLLKYLEPLEKKYIVENTTARVLEPGDILIRQGDQDETMYLIEEGSLEVVDDRLGKGAVLSTLNAGDVIGEMAFLTHMPRSATVRARTAGVVREFDRDNLRFIAHATPEILGKISLALSEILSDRLQQTLTTQAALVQQFAALQSRLQGGAGSVQPHIDIVAASVQEMDKNIRSSI